MRNLNTIAEGIFYPIADGHVLTTQSIPPGELTTGTRYATNSMIEMWDLLRDGVSVGWYFYSAFKVIAKGGYLVTFMESKKGQASEGNIVIRRPEFVVFDIPACGSTVVSMTVSSEMEAILMEQ
jgi:hypothetical protein